MKNKTAAQSQMPDQLFVGSGLWEGFVIWKLSQSGKHNNVTRWRLTTLAKRNSDACIQAERVLYVSDIMFAWMVAD